MNKLIALLLIVFLQLAPAYAGPDFTKAKQVELEGRQLLNNIVNAQDLTKDQKIDIFSQALLKGVHDLGAMECYIDWFVEGIQRAVAAAPLKVQDSIPPNMENADIPEYLVRQANNMVSLQKVQRQHSGASQKIYVIALPITPTEERQLKNADEILNFFLNHSDRIYVEVQQ